MSIWLTGLPNTVAVCGIDYPIKTDFRSWIFFTTILQKISAMEDGPSKTEEQLKLLAAFDSKKLPLENLGEAYAALFAFLRCDRGADAEAAEKSRPEQQRTTQRSFDFDIDALLIHAAFVQAYNINLLQIEYMHWWEFMALFEALPDETMMRQVMKIRTMKTNNKMSNDERTRIARLKSVYALEPIKRKGLSLEERNAMWLSNNDKSNSNEAMGDMSQVQGKAEDE